MRTIRTLLGLTLLSLSLAACSSTAPTPTASASPAPMASSVASQDAVLKLGEFNITLNTDEQELVFSGAPDGQIEVDIDGENHSIKVTESGLLEIPTEEKPASIDAAGALKFGDDDTLVSVAADGSISLDGKPFVKRDGDKYLDARLEDSDKSAKLPEIMVEGDAGTERLVGFVVAYALLTLPGKETTGPADTPLGEPAPAPTPAAE